jgi:hypothetical protein
MFPVPAFIAVTIAATRIYRSLIHFSSNPYGLLRDSTFLSLLMRLMLLQCQQLRPSKYWSLVGEGTRGFRPQLDCPVHPNTCDRTHLTRAKSIVTGNPFELTSQHGRRAAALQSKQLGTAD